MSGPLRGLFEQALAIAKRNLRENPSLLHGLDQLAAFLRDSAAEIGVDLDDDGQRRAFILGFSCALNPDENAWLAAMAVLNGWSDK